MSTHCSSSRRLIDLVLQGAGHTGVVLMQKLEQLEKTVAIMLEQHRSLKAGNAQLQYEKKCWMEEKKRLLAEIDRILQSLDDIDVEGV